MFLKALREQNPFAIPPEWLRRLPAGRSWLGDQQRERQRGHGLEPLTQLLSEAQASHCISLNLFSSSVKWGWWYFCRKCVRFRWNNPCKMRCVQFPLTAVAVTGLSLVSVCHSWMVGVLYRAIRAFYELNTNSHKDTVEALLWASFCCLGLLSPSSGSHRKASESTLGTWQRWLGELQQLMVFVMGGWWTPRG